MPEQTRYYLYSENNAAVEISTKYFGPAKSLVEVIGASDQEAECTEGIAVTMRDGIELMATILSPRAATAASGPVIMVQTPYTPKMELEWTCSTLYRDLLREGYRIVVVNQRGTQWSDGVHRWMRGVAEDGCDTLAWVLDQPWCNGRVGTFGGSSSGEVQLSLAAANPPGLKAIVPVSAGTGVGRLPGYQDAGLQHIGGVPFLVWASWFRVDGYFHRPKLPRALSQPERAAIMRSFMAESNLQFGDGDEWMMHLPSQDLLTALDVPASSWNELITWKPGSADWDRTDLLTEQDTTRVPALHMSGWYDGGEVHGVIKTFEHFSRTSPDQYLIVGPGAHCVQFSGIQREAVGERPIGRDDFDYVGAVVRFLNHWVRDDGAGELDLPHAQYYPLESGSWEVVPAWPPPATSRTWYLTSGGSANTRHGDGRLTESAPTGDEPSDGFRSDPMDPVPSRGGQVMGDVLDQTEVEERPDVLVYTTDPFPDTVRVRGQLEVLVHLSSSALDTDLAVKLVDVYPDGRAFNLVDSIQRLRYVNGFDDERLLHPGEVYAVTFNNMVVATDMAAGHRLRLQIAGSSSPFFERNLNTGGNNYDEDTGVVAENRVHHGIAHPSRIVLPVVTSEWAESVGRPQQR